MPVKQGTKSKIVYFSPQEWEIVCKRAEKCGKRTGTFIRDIAVRGSIKIFDSKPIDSFLISFNRIGNEINQIAKVANSTQSVYAKDIEDMQKSFKRFSNVMENYLLPLKYDFVL